MPYSTWRDDSRDEWQQAPRPRSEVSGAGTQRNQPTGAPALGLAEEEDSYQNLRDRQHTARVFSVVFTAFEEKSSQDSHRKESGRSDGCALAGVTTGGHAEGSPCWLEQSQACQGCTGTVGRGSVQKVLEEV